MRRWYHVVFTILHSDRTSIGDCRCCVTQCDSPGAVLSGAALDAIRTYVRQNNKTTKSSVIILTNIIPLELEVAA